MVRISSRAGRLCLGCISTGMPRPLSVTVTASPLLCSVTVMASAIAVQVFVDGVIDDFPHEVVQPLAVHAADVHRRPLADGFEAFEDGDVGGGVTGSGGGGHLVPVVG